MTNVKRRYDVVLRCSCRKAGHGSELLPMIFSVSLRANSKSIPEMGRVSPRDNSRYKFSRRRVKSTRAAYSPLYPAYLYIAVVYSARGFRIAYICVHILRYTRADRERSRGEKRGRNAAAVRSWRSAKVGYPRPGGSRKKGTQSGR